MKESLAALTGALLIAHASVTVAASNVDLAVKGSITPKACVHTLSEAGNVDYGKVPFKDLSVDSTTFLPIVTLKPNVACEAQTLFALHGRDNRQGSAHFSLPNAYGLGLSKEVPLDGSATVELRYL
ncbi:DUF1120 domain-containing protein [Pseudomonas sp. Marseille-Q1929]|uniref:DUF1120 domain-containing protein n=1 Tax=Pseudomonas sp. Marseille-Q1929 TaxID=2730402 RepID=UPI001A8EAEF1|nr:DUF1120 domain-containing protein [Pseudomonas sp. Marseille-Q1929]MBO0491811.1 DUF1120 domain-containing protein [Pseudomonas sp. Marseille-Q1929]